MHPPPRTPTHTHAPLGSVLGDHASVVGVHQRKHHASFGDARATAGTDQAQAQLHVVHAAAAAAVEQLEQQQPQSVATRACVLS